MSGNHFEFFVDNPSELERITCGKVGDVLVGLARKHPTFNISVANHSDIPGDRRVIVVGNNIDKVVDEFEKKGQKWVVINPEHNTLDNIRRIEDSLIFAI